MTTLLNARQDVLAQMRQKSPRYAALMQPQPIGAAQIQALLDPQTALLQFALGEPHSVLWVVTPATVISRELPGRAEIREGGAHGARSPEFAPAQ